MLPSAEAKALLDREPVKNARALLRYALPIDDKYVRQMQVCLYLHLSTPVLWPGSNRVDRICSESWKASVSPSVFQETSLWALWQG